MRHTAAAALALLALSCAGCGAAAAPATLDRLRAYGLVGAAGESAAQLEAASRPRRSAALDEPSPAVTEVDGLVRRLLPLVFDHVDDPRMATVAARLRALRPARGLDEVSAALAPLAVLLDEWEPALTPAELARFSTDRNVAAHAPAPTPRAVAVAALRSVGSLVDVFRGAPPSFATRTSRHRDLCPSELADLAVAVGAPRDDVLAAVHAIARDVRTADRSAAAADTTPPCMLPPQ